MFSQILLACLNAKWSFKTHWKPCQHHDPFLISLTSCNVLAQHLFSESLPQNYHSLNLRMCFCKDVCVLASKVAPSDPHILVGTTLVWSPSTFHQGWSVWLQSMAGVMVCHFWYSTVASTLDAFSLRLFSSRKAKYHFLRPLRSSVDRALW